MPITFNADEVLEMACQIERDGTAYYRKAAEAVADEDAKVMLSELADMEVEHERVFDDMRRDFAGRADLLADGDEETVRYLRAMAAGEVFGSLETPRLQPGVSLVDVLQHALGREKDTVVFYTSLRYAMPAELGRDKLDAILKEEVGHVVLLSGRLAQAQGRR
ncbi:MAG: ferritin family protein [Deltaproteobacteria bacterium]|nr:ferritin family protein [Deltaproteobacteria bacterium]